MSDPIRRESDPILHNDHEDDPLLEQPLLAGGVGAAGGGVVTPIAPMTDSNEATEEAMDEEADVETGANDDALLSGRSPEFDHLTKPGTHSS